MLHCRRLFTTCTLDKKEYKIQKAQLDCNESQVASKFQKTRLEVAERGFVIIQCGTGEDHNVQQQTDRLMFDIICKRGRSYWPVIVAFVQ